MAAQVLEPIPTSFSRRHELCSHRWLSEMARVSLLDFEGLERAQRWRLAVRLRRSRNSDSILLWAILDGHWSEAHSLRVHVDPKHPRRISRSQARLTWGKSAEEISQRGGVTDEGGLCRTEPFAWQEILASKVDTKGLQRLKKW